MAKLQCKDIPTRPVLALLAKNPHQFHTWFDGDQRDVGQAMPEGVAPKLKLAKMKKLIDQGLVAGCTCGCRGDFQILPKGILLLAAASGVDW